MKSFDLKVIFLRLILDSRRIFDFLDVNQNSYWTYLEFRSWMLLIDRTLSESDIHEIFNEIDQNRKTTKFFFLHILLLFIVDDGLIQYKEFQQYFGTDLLSSEPDIVDLTILFNEIDQNHSGRITVSELLQFFNHQSPLISKEEGELFLGTMSETGNEDSISFKGKTNKKKAQMLKMKFFSSRISSSNASLENLIRLDICTFFRWIFSTISRTNRFNKTRHIGSFCTILPDSIMHTPEFSIQMNRTRFRCCSCLRSL